MLTVDMNLGGYFAKLDAGVSLLNIDEFLGWDLQPNDSLLSLTKGTQFIFSEEVVQDGITISPRTVSIYDGSILKPEDFAEMNALIEKTMRKKEKLLSLEV